MARTITDIDVLREYLGGVLDRAGHHAPNVEDIALAIAGAIVWRKDVGRDLKAFEREGEMKNVLWARIKEKRYAICYNHQAAAIEVREENTHGRVRASFTNANSARDVRLFFESL